MFPPQSVSDENLLFENFPLDPQFPFVRLIILLRVLREDGFLSWFCVLIHTILIEFYIELMASPY